MAIENGNWIKVSYKGTLNDGNVFDTSEGKDPITFEVGAGTVIKGFDAAVVGMEVGDEKEFKIPCAEAYGEASDDHQEEVPKEFFQGVEKIEVGMTFVAQSMMGPLKVKVLTFDGEKAKVSVNHPLAGEDLTFNVKVEAVLTDDEVAAFKEDMAKKQAEFQKQQEEMMKKMQEAQANGQETCSPDACAGCAGSCGPSESLEDAVESEEKIEEAPAPEASAEEPKKE